MKGKWRGAVIGGLVALILFLMMNIIFIIRPQAGFILLTPFYYLFKTLLGGVLYLKLFGSEWREVVSLSLICSAIVGIIIYFIINLKNEK